MTACNKCGIPLSHMELLTVYWDPDIGRVCNNCFINFLRRKIDKLLEEFDSVQKKNMLTKNSNSDILGDVENKILKKGGHCDE